ncbi:MAG: T9SS type A sorting domain-containing protein [Bacteroidia bacterium]
MRLRLFILFFFITSLASYEIAAQWSAFGNGIPSGDFVIGFENYNGALLAYTQPDPDVYEFNGTSWSPVYVSLPLSSGIHRLKTIDSVLYAVTYASTGSNRVYTLSAGNWNTVGGTFTNPGSPYDPTIYDLISYHDTIFVCGEFSRVNTDTINGIAKWNGINWENVGGGLAGGMSPYPGLRYPHQLQVYNGELYVIGNFTTAGGITVNGIAKWNGSSWSAVGSGFNAVGYGMGEYNGELFAGGEFTTAGGIIVSRIAKWNGSLWQDPGIGVVYTGLPGVHAFVHSIIPVQSRLVIAGGFDHVIFSGNTYINQGVFTYNGTTVDTMDGGVDNDVEAIMPYGSGVLVGGGFTMAGSIAADKTALYDFTSGVSSPAIEQLTAFPTIVKNELHLSGEGASVGKNFCIYDQQGKKMKEGTFDSVINVESLSCGFYFLRIEESGSVIKFEKR